MKLEYISSACHALQQLISDPDISSWYADTILKNVSIERAKSSNYKRFSQFTPPSKIFLNVAELAELLNRPAPFVVKFDTSFTGIQTVIVKSRADVKQVYFVAKITNCCQGIVQDYINGREYTTTILVGKHNWVTLGTACDYKKQFENNIGLNTFGLGSTAPCADVHPGDFAIVENVVVQLQKEFDYRGPLSCQFIVDDSNKIWLLEYNARFCDPEFQSTVELVDASRALIQCKNDLFIEQPTIANKRSVTIGLIHTEWPTPQATFSDLQLKHDVFKIRKNHGSWSNNLYWGSITNSGTNTHEELANEIYQWLELQQIFPYRYRKDIGKINQVQTS